MRTLADYPEIAKEWHPTKNGDIRPNQVRPKSDKKFWFLCSKVKSHEWQARLADRTSKGSGCPFCYWRMTPENSLAVKFPRIAKELHPKKNKGVTADKIASKSSKKFWWVCSKGHEYQMQVAERTHSYRGCSICSKFSGSAQETRLFTELKSLFPDAKFRHKIEGVEIDVFLPSANVGVEYDGSYYHRDKLGKDKEKNNLLDGFGIKLVRIREEPLEPISEWDIMVPYRSMTKDDMNNLLRAVQTVTPLVNKDVVSEYLARSDFINDEEFAIYMSYFPSPFPEKSLAETFPEVAAQWDYEKNYPLTPYNFTHGSKHKVYWLCRFGHSHYTTINSKTSHPKSSTQGCKVCRAKKVKRYGTTRDKRQFSMF